MKVRTLVGLLFSSAVVVSTPSFAAFETVSFKGYSLAYSDDSLGGGLDFSYDDDVGTGFGWKIPAEFAVHSSSVLQPFSLASFSVYANEGYKFTGQISAFIGNISFAEAGAWTSPYLSGEILLDGLGMPSASIVGSMIRTETVSTDALRTGYYSYNYEVDLGYNAFSYLTLVTLDLLPGIADPGAVLFSTGQAEVRFSFGVTPVPEPSTYATFLAGLGLLALRSFRKSTIGG